MLAESPNTELHLYSISIGSIPYHAIANLVVAKCVSKHRETLPACRFQLHGEKIIEWALARCMSVYRHTKLYVFS